MRKFVLSIIGFSTLAVAGEAAVVCATPTEMKVLQSAVLQQQLTVAAISCRMHADYNRFVAAYQQKLVQSDRALKAFFSTRPRGENYDAYKSRIANVVSQKSLHDAKFCDNAQKVFDMALGRGMTRRGLAPEPPQMVETGYEGCRPVADTMLVAQIAPQAANPPAPKPQPRPNLSPLPMQAAAVSKPLPVSKLGQTVTVRAEPDAHHERFDRHAVDAIVNSLAMVRPMPTPRPTVSPQAAKAMSLAKVRPASAIAAPVTPTPVTPTLAGPSVDVPVKAPPRLASLEAKAAMPPLPPARWVAEPEASPVPTHVETDVQSPQADETLVGTVDESAAPPAETKPQWQPVEAPAIAERQGAPEDWREAWRRDPAEQDEEDDRDELGAFIGRNVPNAYRPGAVWVGERGPVRAQAAWQPVVYGPPPPWLSAPRGAYMVRGRDGRWMVVIGHQRYWVRD